MRCRTAGGQSLRAKPCQSDVGVFRHAATERGGGGGLWTDEEDDLYREITFFKSSSIPSRTIGPH